MTVEGNSRTSLPVGPPFDHPPGCPYLCHMARERMPEPAGCAPRARWRGVAAALALGLACAGTARSADLARLREITDKWRQARAPERPLEVYLRTLVEADSLFVPDPGPALDRLGPGMRASFDGLSPLLSAELQAQFLGLSSDSLRAEWLRRYWRLKDPTPTTTENERRAEHERRVERARRDFAAEDPPGWDQRGRVLIEFGAPDSVIEHEARVEEGAGFVPARQQWLYLDEGWLVAFERPNPRGPWQLGRASTPLSSRPDISERDMKRLGITTRYAESALEKERASDLIGTAEDRTLLAEGDYEGVDPQVVQHEVRTDLRARALLRQRTRALAAFRQQLETGSERFLLPGAAPEPLWYVFDVDVFKGRPGRMRVEVHYQFVLQDLRFKWRDSTYVASYRSEGVLLDRSVREAARDEYVETLRASDFQSTRSAQLLPGQLVFEVPEGQYRLALRFVDLVSGQEGTYLTDITVPRFDSRQLALSDIEMATKIVYAGDDWRSRFVKNDRLVIPNPISVYQRGRTLTGYFEIYGLQLDAEHTSHYRVTYSIVPRSRSKSQGWFPASGTVERPFATESFTGDGGTTDLVEELRIDVGSLSADAYDVVLTVRDLVAGTEASAQGRFSILD